MAKKYEEEDVIQMVGGRFKLATLLEKRYKELLFGGRPFVEVETDDPLDVLIEEIVQGKIDLIPESEAISAAAAALMSGATSNEAAEEAAARAALEAVGIEKPADDDLVVDADEEVVDDDETVDVEEEVEEDEDDEEDEEQE